MRRKKIVRIINNEQRLISFFLGNENLPLSWVFRKFITGDYGDKYLHGPFVQQYIHTYLCKGNIGEIIGLRDKCQGPESNKEKGKLPIVCLIPFFIRIFVKNV